MDSDCSDSRKRSIDRRRETSRCAARDRRGKEADIFSDLKDVVPIVEDTTVTHLDRIALLRVAATVCRFRKHAGNVVENKLNNEMSQTVKYWREQTVMESLDGFVLIVESDGTILYITESVSIYLGHTQTEMTGISIQDFFHNDDWNDFLTLAGQLKSDTPEDSSIGRSVVFRMKSIISPRGRTLNMKSAIHKPVSFVVQSRRSTNGHVLLMHGITIPAGLGSVNATASAMTKGSEAPSGTYMTRHTCDMRISFASDRLNYILKNELKTLVGTSFYDLVHPADVTIVDAAMREMFKKGHVRTPYYRLLAANRSLAWVMTEATTITHTTKGQKGQYVICLHFILGVQAESESLVVSTEASPSGRSIFIKKEIEDFGTEYVGRQPEVIDNDNYIPLFADNQFSVSESLRSPDNAENATCRKDSYEEVLQWLFLDKPSSPVPGEEQSATCDPTLASAQVVDSSPSSAETTPGFCCKREIGSVPTLSANSGVCRDSSPASVSVSRNQSMAPSPASNPSPCLPSLRVSDNNSLSPCGRGGSARMFSPLPPSNATASQANVVTTPPFPSQTPIVEDLQWEEPDLTGLAPYVPDDDEIEFGADNQLPTDLQHLFGDVNDWSAAQPLVAVGPKAVNESIARQQQQFENFPPPSIFPCYEYSSRSMGGNTASYPMQQQQIWPDPKQVWDRRNNVYVYPNTK